MSERLINTQIAQAERKALRIKRPARRKKPRPLQPQRVAKPLAHAPKAPSPTTYNFVRFVPPKNRPAREKPDRTAEKKAMGEQRPKNAAAVELGRLGGKKGGPARAAKLTSEQRSEIGRKGGRARWATRRLNRDSRVGFLFHCPHCGALPGEPCHTGQTKRPIPGIHAERLTDNS